MKVILSTEAKQDIDDIFEYISRNSIRYAIETTRNIRLCIHNLEISPYLGRYVPELSDKLYRELLYKSYRIIYSIYEEIDTVYIHLVVHDKRNLNSILYIKHIDL